MNFSFIKMIKILGKMLLEFLKALLDLLLLLHHNGWVLKVLHLHLRNGGEHLHVLSELKADQI
jgi:hypothetical protein